MDRCINDTQETCSNGSWNVVEACVLRCHPSLPRCLRMDPYNATPDDLYSGTTDLVTVGATTYDTTNCGVLGGVTGEVRGEMCVVRARNVTTALPLTVTGNRSLLILASGVISVAAIHASANGVLPGPGGGAGGTADGMAGLPAPMGGGGGDHTGTYNDGGGGGGGNGGTGGNGGAADTATGGQGGSAAQLERGEPLVGGGGGGAGGTGGRGGGGGGALQLSSAVRIEINGALRAHGGGGQAPTTTAVNWGSGGGGGAGGTIILEAPQIVLSAGIHAKGGAGSAADGSTQSACVPLADGSDGAEGVDGPMPAMGGTPPAFCAGAGGDSGSSANMNGAGGGDSVQLGNGGGGGGASGRVILRASAMVNIQVPIHPMAGLTQLPLGTEP